MQLIAETFTVRKKFALRISRGTTAQTTNIWLRIQEDGIEGWGEASPFSIAKNKPKDSVSLLTELERIIPHLEQFHPLQRQEVKTQLRKLKVSSSLQAAVDMALYDWLGKKSSLPLWQIWGLSCDRLVPISVTIGIGTCEQALTRLRDWQDTLDFKMLKLKLGSPEGIEADKLMVETIRQAAPQKRITVDANGGWSFESAVYMSQWLANLGVEYIEQPPLPTRIWRSPISSIVSSFTSAYLCR